MATEWPGHQRGGNTVRASTHAAHRGMCGRLSRPRKRKTVMYLLDSCETSPTAKAARPPRNSHNIAQQTCGARNTNTRRRGRDGLAGRAMQGGAMDSSEARASELSDDITGVDGSSGSDDCRRDDGAAAEPTVGVMHRADVALRSHLLTVATRERRASQVRSGSASWVG